MGVHPATRYVSLALIYVIWGSTYLAVRIIVGDDTLTPLQLQLLRCAAATLLCTLIVLTRHLLARAATRSPALHDPVVTPHPATPTLSAHGRARHALVAMGSGILLWTLGNGLTTIATKDAASSFIVMSMGTIPLWTVGVDAVLTRRLPPRRVTAAVLVGFAGLVLVLAPGLTSGSIITPGRGVPIMVLLMVSALTWTLGTIAQERVGPQLDIWELSAWQYLGGTATLLVPVLVAHAPLHLGAVRPAHWVAFAFLVLFGSLIAMAAYSVVLRSFTPAVASTFAYVNPLVGIILGAVFLHETIAMVSLAGLVVVLGAVAVIFAAHSHAPDPAPTAEVLAEPREPADDPTADTPVVPA